MPRKADQFRQSDVTLWGTIALVAFGLAIVGANVSAAIPDAVFAGLHATRFVDRSAADLRAQLTAVSNARAEIAGLSAAEQQLQAANDRLAGRFDGLVEAAGGVRERVGALEDSIPRLIKTLPAVRDVDPTVITGSIGKAPADVSAVTPSETAPVPAARDSTRTDRWASTYAASPSGPNTPAATAADTQAMPVPLASAIAGSSAGGTPAVSSAASAADSRDLASEMPASVDGPARSMPGGHNGAIASAQPAATSSNAASMVAAGRIVPKPADPATVTPVAATASAATPSADAVAMAAQPQPSGPVPLAPLRPTQAAPAAQTGAIASTTPAPAATPDVRAIGVAIGPPVTPGAALAAWEGLAAKVGVMLVGMSPLLADDPAGSGGKVLVAGPISSITIATTLCADIDRAGLACTPMPYVGTELGAAAAAAATP